MTFKTIPKLVDYYGLLYFQTRDHKYFNELFTNSYQYLTDIGRKFYSQDKHIIEDSLNATYVKILTKIDQFNPKYNFYAWVSKIYKNEIYYEYEMKHRKPHQVQLNAMFFDKEVPHYTEDEVDDEKVLLRMELIQMVRKLKEPFRSLIIDMYYNGMNQKQLADKYNVTVDVVKGNLYKARKVLHRAKKTNDYTAQKPDSDNVLLNQYNKLNYEKKGRN